MNPFGNERITNALPGRYIVIRKFLIVDMSVFRAALLVLAHAVNGHVLGNHAGTHLDAAVAAAGGQVLIKNVIPKHMDCISAKLMEMGVHIEEQDDTLLVRRSEPLQRANVKTQPYPGFPTDMQPQIAVVLSLAQGTSLVTEGVYGASRFKYLDELRRMGAHIQVDGRVAVIEGVEQLEGAPVHACDLRAGAALVIAGLAARGTTEISQIQFIERGYEDLVGKLRAVGADIQMVDVPVEAAENEAQIS